jgi:hypothetical protein
MPQSAFAERRIHIKTAGIEAAHFSQLNTELLDLCPRNWINRVAYRPQLTDGRV